MDRKILRKINDLIKDISRTPFIGIGKPEPLKYNIGDVGPEELILKTDLITALKKMRSGLQNADIITIKEIRSNLIFSEKG